MLKGSFIVDRSLRGVRVEKLLDVRRGLPGRPTLTIGAEDRAEVPSGEPLAANRLYPSTQDPSRRFFLPQYAIAQRSDGHPEVQLRYLGNGDGSGVLGRLTITLAWTPPPWAGGELRTIDHRIDLSLRFRVRVKDDPGEGYEQIVELQPPQRVEGSRAASVTVFTDKAQFDAVYQAMRLDPAHPSARSHCALWLELTAEVGVRTWRQVVVGRPAAIDQVTALQHKHALFTTMLEPAKVTSVRRSEGRATVSVRATTVEDRARIHAVREVLADRSATSPSLAGTRASSTATAVRSSGHVDRSSTLLNALRTNPTLLRRTTATPLRPVVGIPQPGEPIVARPIAEPVGPVIARPVRPIREPIGPVIARPVRPIGEPVLPVPPPPIPEPVRPMPPRPVLGLGAHAFDVLTPSALANANAPTLADAIGVTDLSVAGRKVVPVKLALDRERRPAIVDTELETAQTLPFELDPERHREVFVGSYSGPDIHLLFPHLIVDDGTPRTIYTDNLMPEVVHVPPTEFRLVRDGHSPFAPTMTFVASDFVTTHESDESAADVFYRVAVVYRLEPWVSPALLERTREELERLRPGVDATALRFTPIVPRGATLILADSLLGGAQQRSDARIDPVQGITDVLDLDSATFTQLWRRLAGIDDGAGNEARATGAITGTVAFTLFDGTRATSTVRISLAGDGDDLVDVTHVGLADDATGDHEVLVRNRVESPVELVELRAAALPEGTIARPVGATALVGRVLAPQEHVIVRYRLDHPGTETPTIRPLVIARSRPEPRALLKLLMRSESGFESLGFSVTVKAADGSFAATPDGTEALIGLRVEFDDGTTVELTADDAQQEVGLLGRLLDQLTGSADDQHRYLYRVTNLHPTGEGARSGWFPGQGEGTLEVAPAAGVFAF